MVAGSQVAALVVSQHATDMGAAGDTARGDAGDQSVFVESHHATGKAASGDTVRGGAGGYGTPIFSRHATDTGGAGDAARRRAVFNGSIVPSCHATDIAVAGDTARHRAVFNVAIVPSCHATDKDVAGDAARHRAVFNGAIVLSCHATDIAVAGDAARHRAVFNGAPATSHHADDIDRTVIACYLYALQLHVLHRADGAEVAEQTHIVVTRCNGQPRDGLIFAVEGAGVLCFIISYRRPIYARQVDVGGEGAVQRAIAPRGLRPRQQPVGGVDRVGVCVDEGGGGREGLRAFHRGVLHV